MKLSGITSVVIVVILLQFFSGSDSKKLSLPQYDVNPDRQTLIKQMSAAIHNEPRFHIVNNVSYPIPPGPIPRNGSIVLSIMAQGQKLLLENANPVLPQIIETAASAKINGLNDYKKLYKSLEKFIETPSTVVSNDDVAFGEDRMTIKPGHMKLMRDSRSIPEHSNVRRSAQQVCGDYTSKLVKNRRVFILDFSFVSKYNDPKALYKYAPSSKTYFCINNKKKLVPFAIHIVDTDLIYTPYDSKNEWTLAKMAVNAAQNNLQPLDHFLETHLMIEPVRVEMMRTMSTSHPMYVLLEHHFTQLYFNTQIGLSNLFSADTNYDLLFGFGATGTLRYVYDRSFNTSFRDTFGRKIYKNGLHHIPNYKYRDDSRLLLKAIKKFIWQYLTSYYKTEKDVQGDFELQAWAKQVSKVSAGFPTHFNSRVDLVRTMGELILRVAVLHHSLNSDIQWHICSFPYSLSALFAPMPTKKGVHLDLEKYLIPRELMPAAIGLYAFYLRPMGRNQTLLGSYQTIDLGNFAGKAIRNHEIRMKSIDNIITRREQYNSRPYDFLKPSRLPYYVWI